MTARMIPPLIRGLLSTVPLDTMIQNSIKDMHVEGLDYVCLMRSRHLTVKLYFFQDNLTEAPEVVAPHNHRYDFDTYCLKGSVTNRIYSELDEHGRPIRHPRSSKATPMDFEHFEYWSPHVYDNDPNIVPFVWRGHARLIEVDKTTVTGEWPDRIEHYFMNGDNIHTITINEPGTVLCLLQYEDRDLSYTTTYLKDRTPPSLKGANKKFTAPELLRKTIGGLVT